MARGIDDPDVLSALAVDPDLFVRAAALESASRVGYPSELHSLGLAALSDPAWEVRVGAVRALSSPDPMLPALSDPNLDVRKAAVRALTRWAEQPHVALALKRAQDDSDADVRAYARRALDGIA